MSEATKAALRAAEEQLARAQAALAESTAKREEARAQFEAVEQKRRSLARSVLMGAIGDQKSTRAAANARDDAQRLVEDMDMVVDEAGRFVSDARASLLKAKFEDGWEELMELGRHRADVLQKVIDARDAMYAAAEEFREIGSQIRAHASRARMTFPHGAFGVSPDRVLAAIAADKEMLATLIIKVMPHELFMKVPEHIPEYVNDYDKEQSFWDQQEIDPELLKSAA